MSVSASIENVESALRPYVGSGAVPGYVAAISVGGERHTHAAGAMAIEPGAGAMTAQTMFRIASLAKLVAGVLALSLERDGVIALTDPVGRWLPELAEPRVLRDVRGPLEDTVAAERPIDVRDLLTMTAGMGRFLPDGPLRRAMEEEGLESGGLPPDCSHDEFMARLGGLPLAHQPGAGWLYHTSIDALSVLMARAAGRTLAELVADRVAGPLGLRGLDFHAREAARLATAYEPTDDGLELLDLPSGPFSRPPRFESLGSGLVCTAAEFPGAGSPLCCSRSAASPGRGRRTSSSPSGTRCTAGSKLWPRPPARGRRRARARRQTSAAPARSCPSRVGAPRR